MNDEYTEPTNTTKLVDKVEKPASPQDLRSAIEAAGTAIQLAEPVIPREYHIVVEEADISNKVSKTDLVIPDLTEWSQGWGIVTRAVLAKKGNAAWKDKSIPEIIYAIMYAESLKLSFEQGDVFMAEGRLSTTAHAKIKYALNSGRVKSYHVELKDLTDKLLKLPWATWREKGIFEHCEIESTVTVKLANGEVFTAPPAYLSEWFVGRNPNWRERPRYMLWLSSAGKALIMVCPLGGSEPDEAPPVPGASSAKS